MKYAFLTAAILLLGSLMLPVGAAPEQDPLVMQILTPLAGNPITTLANYQGTQLLLLHLKLPAGATNCQSSVTSQQNQNAQKSFSFACPSTGNVGLPILAACGSTDSCTITVQLDQGEKTYIDSRTYTIRLAASSQTPAIEILTPPSGSTIASENLITYNGKSYVLVKGRIPGGASQCTITVTNTQIAKRQYSFSNCRESHTFAIPVPGQAGDCGNVAARQVCTLTLSTATHAAATSTFTVDLVPAERPVVGPPTGPATLTIRDIRLLPQSQGKTSPGMITGAEVTFATSATYPRTLTKSARLSIIKDGQEVCFGAGELHLSQDPDTAKTYPAAFTRIVAARGPGEASRDCVLASGAYHAALTFGSSIDPYGADNSDSPTEIVVAPVSGASCPTGLRNGPIEGEPGHYCRNGNWAERKAAGTCVNHFECASNLCIGGSCIGSGQEVEVSTIATALCDIGVRVVNYC